MGTHVRVKPEAHFLHEGQVIVGATYWQVPCTSVGGQVPPVAWQILHFFSPEGQLLNLRGAWASAWNSAHMARAISSARAAQLFIRNTAILQHRQCWIGDLLKVTWVAGTVPLQLQVRWMPK